MAISANGIRIRIPAFLLEAKCGPGWIPIPSTGVPEDVRVVLAKYADSCNDGYINPTDARLEVNDNTWEAVLAAARVSSNENLERSARMGCEHKHVWDSHSVIDGYLVSTVTCSTCHAMGSSKRILAKETNGTSIANKG
jgi:hypothetical protein